MGIYIKAIIIILFLLLLITFGVENSGMIRLNYYHLVNFEFPVYGLIYASILLGIIIGMVMGIRSRHIIKKEIKILKTSNKELSENLITSNVEDEMEK